ncbi:cysteine desulfurase [Limisphaera ngatamarikiensis]|uniref:cysteine desulfurase n=1 Tax=Limisphaera ngatamarikiensis TaxID=1324935 RepID=A0A6M1RY98_9BACT|nr:cysteine desulfurase family protein [Limisphaera ngatamarikiensis]NGO40324.1 cysteine desulfurase [Limisphaera ngatamarikiensis]
MRTIYCDYNATTPLDPGVRAAMEPFLTEVWGNPSSLHRIGRRARAALDEARERAASVLGVKPGEIVFTSGGTESVNLAILGAARARRERGRHLITSAIEHHAVLHAMEYLERREGFEVTRLPVTPGGFVDPETLRRAIRPDTVLVSIMAANNEIGTLQPVRELAAACRERGVLFHTDAVQFFGKVPFESVRDLGADLVSLCAHKFHGPKGAGLLYIRSPLQIDPILFGGPHENERRAGTENLAAIAGLVRAMEQFLKPPVFEPERMRQLTCRLLKGLLQVPGVHLLGSPERRLPNTVAVGVEGLDSATLVAALDVEGVCASAGSACTSGALEPSHVAVALGVPSDIAAGLVRFSLGRETTEADVHTVIEVFQRVVQVGRSCGQPAGRL